MLEAVDITTHGHLWNIGSTCTFLHSVCHRKHSERLPELSLVLHTSDFLIDVNCVETRITLCLFKTVVLDWEAIIFQIVVLCLLSQFNFVHIDLIITK